jgi:hypothetical protein
MEDFQELLITSNMERYNILCNGRVIYKDLSEESMMDVLDDLSLKYYEEGTPHPDEIVVEFVST